MKAVSKYNSKVDWWLASIIIFLFIMGAASLLFGIWELISGVNDYLWFVISGLFIVLLIVGLTWPMYYELQNETLLVRHGFIRSTYKYSAITYVKPSRNPLSSPALSLDRLMINYSGKFGFFLISPKDKEAFMKDLVSRTEHLEYLNGEVVLKR